MYTLTLELDDREVRVSLEAAFCKDPLSGESGYLLDDDEGFLTKSEAVEEIIRRDGRVQLAQRIA